MTQHTPMAATAVALLALSSCAAEPREEAPMSTTSILQDEGVAIDGFDPVSYSEGRPTSGRAEYELSWSGARWRFASAEHRARFERAPERYAPQYGGHCALAMSLGQVAPGSPKAWSIDDDRLYFHNSAITAFLFKYLPGRMRAADKNWSALAAQSNQPEPGDGKASL